MKEYLIKQRKISGGVRKIYKFPNGYGASVVSNAHSYFGDMGLWRIVILDKKGYATYKTPITDDVMGRLNDDEVIEVLNKIKELEG